MKRDITSRNFKGYHIDLELLKDNGNRRGAYAVELLHELACESYRFVTCSIHDCEKTNTTWLFGDTVMASFMNRTQTWIPTTDQFGTLLRVVKFLRELFPALNIRKLLVDSTEIKDPKQLCDAISNMQCLEMRSKQEEKFESRLMNQLVSCLENVKSLEIENLEGNYIFEQVGVLKSKGKLKLCFSQRRLQKSPWKQSQSRNCWHLK